MLSHEEDNIYSKLLFTVQPQLQYTQPLLFGILFFEQFKIPTVLNCIDMQSYQIAHQICIFKLHTRPS